MGDIGRELVLEGLAPGTKAYGWSNGVDDGDYLKKITTEHNGQKQTLLRQPDKSYMDEYGHNFKFNIKGFGNSHIQIKDYSTIFPKIPNAITTGEPYSYVNDKKLLEDAMNNSDGKRISDNPGGKRISDNLTKSATALKWSLQNDPKVTGNPALKDEIYKLLVRYHGALEGVSLKNGGIIKAQKGASFDAYMKKLESNSENQRRGQQTSIVVTNKPIRNVTGTLGDEDTESKILDAVSIAGAAGSFIPGYGAIGGGVTTAADLMKDLHNDASGSDIAKHLAFNLGFTALSAIGLGSLRAVKGVAEVGEIAAKTANASVDAEKFLVSSRKLAALDNLSSGAKKYQKAADLLINEVGAKGKTLEDIKKDISLISDVSKKQELSKAFDLVHAAKESFIPSLVGRSIKSFGAVERVVTQGLPSLGKIGETSMKVLGSKPVKYGIAGVVGSQGVRSALDVYNTVTGEDGSWKDIKVDDIKNIAFAASLGENWIRNARGASALKSQASNVSAKAFQEVGTDKGTFTLDDIIEKAKSNNKIYTLPKARKLNAEELEKTYNQTLADKINEKEGLVGENQLTGEHIKSVTIHPEQKGIWKLNSEEGYTPTGNGAYNDEKAHALAKKIINRDISSFGSPFSKREINTTRVVEKPIINEPVLNKINEEVIKETPIKKVSIPQKNPLSKRVNPLKLPDQALNKQTAKAIQAAKSRISPRNLKTWSIPFSKQGGILKYQNPSSGIWSIKTPWNQQNDPTKFPYLSEMSGELSTAGITAKKLQSDIPWKHGMVVTPQTNVTSNSNVNIPIQSNGINQGGGFKDNSNSLFSGLLNGVKNVDKADLMNTALYMNTVNANKNTVNKNIQAATNVPLKTMLPNQQLRMYNPYNDMAKQAEVGANKMGSREAVTSNANINNATKLEAYTKGQDVASKYRVQGAGAINNAMQQQQNADYKTLATNIGIGDQNVAAIRQGQSRALQEEGQLGIAALNNLLLSFQKNAAYKQQNQYNKGIYDILSDPKYKAAKETYANAQSQETQDKYYNQYLEGLKAYDSTAVKPSWESSQNYRDLQKIKGDSLNIMNAYNVPLNNINLARSFGQSYYKKGGNLTKK